MNSFFLISVLVSLAFVANGSFLSKRILDTPTCFGPTFWNETDSNCDACPNNCEVCALDATSGNVMCSLCYGGYEVTVDHLGCELIPQIPTCWDGAFWNASDSQCDSCPDTACKTCSFDVVSGNVLCSVCYQSYVLNAESVCEVPATVTTTTCWEGTFLNGSNCDSCPDTFCKACGVDVSGSVLCSECYQSYMPSADNTTCVSIPEPTTQGTGTCWEGAYWNYGLNSCQDCQANCKTCEVNAMNGYLACGLCYPGYVLSDDSKTCA